MQVFTFYFDFETTNLILEALGELPFKRSAAAIQQLHAQADAQLRAQSAKQDEPTTVGVPTDAAPSSPVKPRGPRAV